MAARRHRPLFTAIALAVMITLGSCCLVCTTDRGTAPDSPVFIIVADAASASFLGCYGAHGETSPNIDRFAEEAVLFENAYSQTASTPSSTASLVTGLRPTTHHVSLNSGLPADHPTLAEVLAEGGVKTFALIGNPFAGAVPTGLVRGYDTAVQVYALPGVERTRPRQTLTPYRVTEPADVSGQLFGLLEQIRKQPSFVYAHYLQPHRPYNPPGLFTEPEHPIAMPWSVVEPLYDQANKTGSASTALVASARSLYRANIRYVDDDIGNLIERLKREGLYDLSLIIIMSDHGDAFFEHRRFGHNATLYDDMLRIPLLMKFPKRAGVTPRRVQALAETIDVMPTVLDFLGLPVPEVVEGESLWPLIQGQKTQLKSPEVCVCTQDRASHAIRVGSHKYIFYRHTGREELFDLSVDQLERTNLVGQNMERAALLRSRLEELVDLSTGTAPDTDSRIFEDTRTLELLKNLGYVD